MVYAAVSNPAPGEPLCIGALLTLPLPGQLRTNMTAFAIPEVYMTSTYRNATVNMLRKVGEVLTDKQTRSSQYSLPYRLGRSNYCTVR